MILSFDEPLDAAWPDNPPGLDNPPVVDASPGVDNASGGVRRWRLASGLHVRPVLIRTHGHQHGVQLSLTPAGTRALLGVPMGALVHALADHGDLPLGIPDPLHARLAESPWQQRFALLEEHLLATVGRNRAEVPRDMTQGWALLGRRRGRLGHPSWRTRWGGRGAT